MSAVFQTNTIIPSIATSTMTGTKSSEIFTLLGDITTAPIDIEDMSGTTPADAGIYQRINSDGWSTLQVWQVCAAADAADAGSFVVVGKRPFVSSSFITDNITTASVFGGLTASNVYLPCPVISSSVVNPGTDSDDTSPNTPPMGLHQVSSGFTFNNHAGTLQDVSATLSLLSDTNTTYIGGGTVIDVRGTTEITLVPTVQAAGEGYFIGQFIA